MTILTTGEGELTVKLCGEIDHHSVKEMREEIDLAIERDGPRLLILDFGGVTFMDSSGIGLVMGRFRLMNETGGKIKIQNTPAHMRKVMRLAGLDKLATIDSEGVTK